jgi:hypothetical protein
MLIKTGGGSPSAGEVGGIHWHMNVANEITYIAGRRATPGYSLGAFEDRDGKITGIRFTECVVVAERHRAILRSGVWTASTVHNRPTHIYLSPNEAVDRSLTAGNLDVALPFVRRRAVAVLSAPYTTNDEALAAIESELTNFYRTSYPDIFATRK